MILIVEKSGKRGSKVLVGQMFIVIKDFDATYPQN